MNPFLIQDMTRMLRVTLQNVNILEDLWSCFFAKQWNVQLYFYTEGKSNSVPLLREIFAVFNAIVSTVEAIKCVRLEMYTNTVHMATHKTFD